jgi:UDP-N-acetylmuramate--alanine ligase
MIIINGDDMNSRCINGTGAKLVRIGMSADNDYRILEFVSGNGMSEFCVRSHEGENIRFKLGVPGIHNAINAVMAAVVLKRMGLNWDQITASLAGFQGSKRRFEKIAEKKNIIFYDDYAHHPAEIETTLAGLRLWYPGRRIVSVFQPHTYSRTKALLAEFSRSFGSADIAIFSEIYASARENPEPDFSGRNLSELVKKYLKQVYFVSSPGDIETELKHILQPGDVVIFLGAGNIFNWGRKIAENY